MTAGKDVRKLKARLEELNPTRDATDVVDVLDALSAAEPDNPRWPHRKGDTLRKLGDLKPALAAYEHAVGLYTKAGFITRALAMAKTILAIDPSRIDVLERVDPEEARKLHRVERRGMIPSADTGKLVLETVQRALENKTQDLHTHDLHDAPALSFEDTQVDDSIEIDLSEPELAERLHATETDAEPSAGKLAKLPAFPLFAETPKAALHAMVAAAELVELPNGAQVVRTGDPADSLFAIVEGSVIVRIPGIVGAEIVLAEGDVFGEACLLEREPRRADVIVKSKLTALKIPKEALAKVVAAFPGLGAILFELLTRRLVGNLIQSSPLFVAFDLQSRLELARLFEVRRAAKGTVLVEAGKKTAGLCLPLTGRVRISSKDGAAWQNRTAATGSMFGQNSLLSDAASEITVKALVDMVVLWLPAREFTRVAATYPPALAHLADLAASEPSFGGLS